MTNQSRTQRSSLTRCAVIAMAFLGLYAGTAPADAVTDWNNVVIGVTINGGRSNPETGIAAAYMHIAIYDAIASIDGRYTPFATLVANAPGGASREAAAAEAAYRILIYLYPAATWPPSRPSEDLAARPRRDSDGIARIRQGAAASRRAPSRPARGSACARDVTRRSRHERGPTL